MSLEKIQNISYSYNASMERNNSDVFSTIVVHPKEDSGDILENNLWGFIGKILLDYNKQFNKTGRAMKCSPAFILFRGRSGKSEIFSHTMGMFLELIPVIVWNESIVQVDYSLRKQLENYKNLRKDTSVDFLTYINHLDREQRGLFDFSHIPVINFLGIYDFLDESEFFSNVQMKKLKKGTSNHSLIISVKDEAIHISMYVAEDKARALKAEIEKINLVED